MANIKMLKLVSGEDVIYEELEKSDTWIKAKNCIQLTMIPSPGGKEVNFGIMPFPIYSQIKGSEVLDINISNIVLFTLPDQQFLDQYNSIFNNIIAPSGKIIV